MSKQLRSNAHSKRFIIYGWIRENAIITIVNSELLVMYGLRTIKVYLFDGIPHAAAAFSSFLYPYFYILHWLCSF